VKEEKNRRLTNEEWRMMKGRQTVLWVGLAVVGLLARAGMGAQVEQFQPTVSDPNFFELRERYVNDDDGAVYDSATVTVYSNLLMQIWMVPTNQIRLASIQQLVNGFTKFRIFNHVGEGAEVNTNPQDGWKGTQISGVISISHHPDTPDDPGDSYDEWSSTRDNPSSDTMLTKLSIHKSLLDGNGNGWSTNDAEDYLIVLTTNVLPNAFVGYMNIHNQFSAPAFDYAVIPMPVPQPVAIPIGGIEVSGSGVQIMGTVSNEAGVKVEASTNLMEGAWVPVTTVIPTNGVFTYVETNQVGAAGYFRAKQ